MRSLFAILIVLLSFSARAREWKSFKDFTSQTQSEQLTSSDWLISDRKLNTLVWQNANRFNLINNLPEEYTTIKQRRDFYLWYYTVISKKGHDVVWPKMAHFISNKLRLIKAFPYTIFTNKNVKSYAYDGSKIVFNSAFIDLKILFYSTEILIGDAALDWDDKMLKKEQYQWLETIYETIDKKAFKSIDRMAKGKGFYSFVVAKKIRFKGNISKPDHRYDYALLTLRVYCKQAYQ